MMWKLFFAKKRELSAARIENIETIKKFICNEESTRFYLDNKLNSYMQPNQTALYLWLDSGYTDYKGNPILISLLRNGEDFTGHVVGNVYSLAENVRAFFRLNRKSVSEKIEKFKNKYEAKIDKRKIRHIEDEQEYLIKSCNISDGENLFAQKFAEMDIDFEPVDDAESEEDAEDVQEETLSEAEEEITISILIDKMESVQAYMDELLQIIENMSNETGAQDLGVNIMQGIAKLYGFSKKDFEFVNYEKAKDFTERIRRDGRYRAVIYGECPHKTSALAGYSSTVEKLKNGSGMPYVAHAC